MKHKLITTFRNGQGPITYCAIISLAIRLNLLAEVDEAECQQLIDYANLVFNE